jgi:hypothetical protein
MQEFHIFLKNDKRKFYDRFAIFLFVLALISTGIYLFNAGRNILLYGAGILILLLMFYALIRKELRVTVNKKQIVYPSIPVKKISWPSVSNLILKEGLLTIDMKNNRIIQQYIDDAKTTVDERIFNEFCSQQLKANG